MLQDVAGFLRINCEGDVSDVPYVKHAKEKHLPVIYFDGDTSPLQDVAFPIDGWEMAHLRLLFNVQGVREELINYSFSFSRDLWYEGKASEILYCSSGRSSVDFCHKTGIEFYPGYETTSSGYIVVFDVDLFVIDSQVFLNFPLYSFSRVIVVTVSI